MKKREGNMTEGRTGKGRTEKGRTGKRGTEKGGTEKGRTEKGRTEERKAEKRRIEGGRGGTAEEKSAGAYFTVEAALVLPMVLAEVVLVIYLLFFQYNRCLMEQDAGILALRGSTMEGAAPQDIITWLEKQENSLDTGKYIAWEKAEVKMRLEKGVLCIEKSGMLQFPFAKLSEGVASEWGASVSAETHVISPVSFIRSYRRLTGGNHFADRIS